MKETNLPIVVLLFSICTIVFINSFSNHREHRRISNGIEYALCNDVQDQEEINDCKHLLKILNGN